MLILVEIILINVLKLVSVVKTETVQHKFKVTKNRDIDMTIGDGNLISSVNQISDLVCLESCNSNFYFLTTVFDNSQGRITNCFLYKRHFNITELISSSTSSFYEKNIPIISSKFLLI